MDKHVEPKWKYLAFDPGQTTGWAGFNADGTVNLFGNLEGLDNLSDFIEDLTGDPEVIVYEDYVINPNIPQGGTRPVASEAIGIIKAHVRIRNRQGAGIKLVPQPASIKAIGYMLAGTTPPKRKKDTHYMDSVVHGVFYLEKNGLRKNRLAREKPKNV